MEILIVFIIINDNDDDDDDDNVEARLYTHRNLSLLNVSLHPQRDF